MHGNLKKNGALVGSDTQRRYEMQVGETVHEAHGRSLIHSPCKVLLHDECCVYYNDVRCKHAHFVPNLSCYFVH